MPIAKYVNDSLANSSMIRKLFEEGAALKKRHGEEAVFDFSIGNPDVEPPLSFHEMFLKMAEEDAPKSHGYMPNAGFPDARAKIAKKVGREHHVEIDGTNIIMSVGAAGALNVVLKSILNQGDEVIVTKPYFLEYKSYIANHGGKLTEIRAAENFDIDVPSVKKALSEKTAAVLINSPNNPTGKVYDEKNIALLSEVLLEHGKKCGRFPYLIADEPYREIVYDGIVVPPVLSAYPHAIVVTSYSKNLSLPGERIGYIAVGNDIDDKNNLLNALIWATRVLGFVNAPALMQRIVSNLTNEKCNVETYAKRRDVFKKVLDDAGLQYNNPQGAFYLFVKVPSKDGKEGNDIAFSDHLKKYFILGVPGSGFAYPGFIRFAYCVNESIIKASAAAFKQAVEQWE
ncbi:MAG: pyridoxal phosphate-dependent aminotransferase [Termitinemataceae bacterium]|nr:MAG: pyridoxal phosphate-dependent aminotransferase [Termitinemataceae bacterium]